MSFQILNSPFLHPFLFVLFPLVFIFSYNNEFLSVDELFFPILIFIGILSAILIICSLIVKNRSKLTIILSIGILIFFSYGHIQNGLIDVGLELSNKLFVPIVLVVFFSCVVLLIKIKSDFKNITKIINSIALTVLFLSAVNLINFDSTQDNASVQSYDEMTLHSKFNPPPNVFYIVLDAYGGYDSLKKYYDFDNIEFINELEKRGFVTVDNSRSNYGWTYLSLTSTLNMKYHDNFEENDKVNNYEKVYDSISENQVMKNFKELGYKVVNLNSGWGNTRDIQIVDETYCGSLNSFVDSQVMISILDNSILKPVYTKFLVDDRRAKVLCQFETIPDILLENNQPVFVFAHLITPHKPYIFDANGGNLETKSLEFGETDYRYRDFRYIEQLQFVNFKTLDLIDKIKENSDTPPIIIIQSDHGSEFPIDSPLNEQIEEKMSNFHSYMLPNDGSVIFYDEVTSVNTFRLIFNYYFNGNYEILEDRSYWSEFNPFDNPGYPEFIDVTNDLK